MIAVLVLPLMLLVLPLMLGVVGAMILASRRGMARVLFGANEAGNEDKLPS